MMIFRPGQRLVIPGVQVLAPRVTSAAATWWDNNGAISGCVAAYAPKDAASLAASYTNLANPGTYTAAPGVAPTWNTTDGWIGNGTSQYLTTGVVPVPGGSVIVRFSGAVDGNNLYGSLVAGNDGKDFFIDGAATGLRYANGGRLTKAVLTSGVVAVAGNTVYRNGSAESGTMTAASSTTIPIVILARNVNGGINSYSAVKIQALAIYNVTLTAGEVATITTAMQAL